MSFIDNKNEEELSNQENYNNFLSQMRKTIK